MFEEELYKWVLVPEPRAGVLRFYITLRFKDSLLCYIEANIMVEKQGTPMKNGFLQVLGDEPDEYIDMVLDLLGQLLEKFGVSEEHYEQHIYL